MKALLFAFFAEMAETWNWFWRGWNRFWFSAADPTTLAAIRIVAGAVVVYVHLTPFADILEFIGPNAWIDQQAIAKIHAIPEKLTFFNQPEAEWRPFFGMESLWFHIENPTAIVALNAVLIVAAGCFMVGFCSRTTSIIVWVGHLSYIQRGMTLNYGMDTILILLLLYLMFAPTGAALSVDAWLARRRRVWNGNSHSLDALPRPSVAANFVTRLIQIHLCIFYFAAGLAKLQGHTWWNGTAIYYTMMAPEFSLIDMGWLAATPWLWVVISQIGVWFTLFTEITFPFFIWNPRLRPVSLLLAWMLQFGIGAFMGLGSFQTAMFAGTLAFIAPETIRRVIAGFGRKHSELAA